MKVFWWNEIIDRNGYKIAYSFSLWRKNKTENIKISRGEIQVILFRCIWFNFCLLLFLVFVLFSQNSSESVVSTNDWPFLFSLATVWILCGSLWRVISHLGWGGGCGYSSYQLKESFNTFNIFLLSFRFLISRAVCLFLSLWFPKLDFIRFKFHS